LEFRKGATQYGKDERVVRGKEDFNGGEGGDTHNIERIKGLAQHAF
jgi:hypothetical protein